MEDEDTMTDKVLNSETVREAIRTVLEEFTREKPNDLVPVKEFQASLADVLGTSGYPAFWELTKKDEKVLKDEGVIRKVQYRPGPDNPRKLKGWAVGRGPQWDYNPRRATLVMDTINRSGAAVITPDSYGVDVWAMALAEVQRGEAQMIYVRGEVDLAKVRRRDDHGELHVVTVRRLANWEDDEDA